MNKILLVEDDLILGESLAEFLEENHFKVTWKKDGNEAIDITYNNFFDLYLFDIDIPFINGFDLLKSLRQSGDNTPTIFLTAKIKTQSLAYGFEIGADDYIKKPFDIDELLIRINTQIKKTFKIHTNTIKYKNIIFDISTKIITIDNNKISLTPIQFTLFELFIKNIDKQLLKEDILYHIYKGEEGSEPALRVQITRLKKLGLNISNQRGIGYKLEKL
jgi:DNA-binding response OmpR family regulator